jgi:hypothetical protein
MSHPDPITRVLVAEDIEDDFMSMKESIEFVSDGEISVINAKTIEDLWAQIQVFEPHVLVQDINIPVSDSDSGTGDSGLSNLFDIFHVYSKLPVVIYSGYVVETHDTIIKILTNDKPLPLRHVLDKSNYEVSDVEAALKKANLFRLNSGDWYQAQLEDVKSRLSQYKKQLKDSAAVFNDEIDFNKRAEAEARQNKDGKCPLIFFLLCQSFENFVLKHSAGRGNLEQKAMGQNVNQISGKFRFAYDLTQNAHKCWQLRNNHVHSLSSVDTLKNARFLNRTISEMQELCF